MGVSNCPNHTAQFLEAQSPSRCQGHISQRWNSGHQERHWVSVSGPSIPDMLASAVTSQNQGLAGEGGACSKGSLSKQAGRQSW